MEEPFPVRNSRLSEMPIMLSTFSTYLLVLDSEERGHIQVESDRWMESSAAASADEGVAGSEVATDAGCLMTSVILRC